MNKIFNIILIFAVATLAVRAQVPPPMPTYQPLAEPQLEQLLGPIALYPDPLISIILPASTFPTEIVLADRYLNTGGDPNAIDQQPWDPSVQALAHYPQVLSWMDDNLNWTTQMGQAFLNQQQDVMNAIQTLRAQAYNLGNLQSTPQQQVVNDNGYIEILPATPDDVYVPNYQPNVVYYQQAYGAPFITFSVGYIIGPWLCCDFNWHDHHLVYWDRNHPRPVGWWQHRPDWKSPAVVGHTTVWNPANHPAVSQGYQGDRGWNNNTVNRAWTAPAISRPPPAVNQNVANYQRPAVNNQRPADNAFLGIDNAQNTRDYSARGGDSMKSAGAPVGGGVHGGVGGAPVGGGVHGGVGGAPVGGGPYGGVGGAPVGGGPYGGVGGAPPMGGGGGGGGRR